MSHQTVTPEPKEAVPRQQGLYRRGAKWYVNIKIPKDLQKAFGKEHIRESLHTSDFKEAGRKVIFQRMRWQTLFDEERAKLSGSEKSPQEQRKQVLLSITEQDAYEMACRFLILQERKFRQWWDKEGSHLSGEELHEVEENLETESTALSGGGNVVEATDGSFYVKSFLKDQGFDCPPTSPAFETLRPLFQAARKETIMRSLDMIEGNPVQARDTQFREVFGHVAIPDSKPSITLGELLERFTKTQRDVGRSESTFRAYVLPFRLLRETLGESTSLAFVTKDSVEKVCDLIRQLPANATQRYPGMTLAEAAKEAEKAGNVNLLKKKTQSGYYDAIAAIFNFAVGKGLMKEHPAKDTWLRQTFSKERPQPKAQFTIEELNKLFRSPLYTGCVNDWSGYAKKGDNHMRRGRFWIPLLSLFHGLRCNEACQLYTEDVKSRDGIDYLAIRATREDGTACEKRLKTAQSERDVPLHPALVRIGFLEFVKERAKDSQLPRLFPELDAGNTGYFSNAFSKWFGRFIKAILGTEIKATFHSFRHQFRDATRAARLNTETIALLGGWEGGGGDPNLVMNRYGRGSEFFRMLAEDIAKVEYPGLDLSHLVPQIAGELTKKRVIRDR